MVDLNDIGYPGYKIDVEGNIYSKRSGLMLSVSVVNDGAKKVQLVNNYGKKKQVFVHRIIAMMYIANPENKPQVDHIDGNKHNNNVANLRWCTNAENQEYRDAQGNSGKDGICKKIQWGTDVYTSIKGLARIIADMRGSKMSTVVKELKAVRYGPKVLYGKYCELVE